MNEDRWLRPGSDRSFTFYCVVAWHVALIPSILLVLAAHAAFSGAGADVERLAKPAIEISRRNPLLVLVVAPLVETLLLALVVELLRLATRRPAVIAALSALAWGAAHAWFHPLWFFGTVWSFYVFSRGYLAWRPVSYKHALGAAALPHALVNASALLMQFIAQRQ